MTEASAQCQARVVVYGITTCTCMKQAHPESDPHECACLGSWLGDGEDPDRPDFIVVNFPEKIIWPWDW